MHKQPSLCNFYVWNRHRPALYHVRMCTQIHRTVVKDYKVASLRCTNTHRVHQGCRTRPWKSAILSMTEKAACKSGKEIIETSNSLGHKRRLHWCEVFHQNEGSPNIIKQMNNRYREAQTTENTTPKRSFPHLTKCPKSHCQMGEHLRSQIRSRERHSLDPSPCSARSMHS